MKVDHSVLALFAAQHGVASLAQLIERQLSPRTIGRARQRNELIPVLPGVYLLGGDQLTFEGRAMAVQLHCGEACFLSGTTAGALFGLRSMPKRRIQVTIRGRVRVSLPSWVQASVTSWIAPDCVELRADGLRCTDPYHTLLGLARQFNEQRFQRAAEDAWHRHLITPGQAAQFLERYRGSGRAGVGRFERWLDKTGAQELLNIHRSSGPDRIAVGESARVGA